MTDYIPREAVLEFVEPDARPFLAERIKTIPAADVVERASGIIGVIPTADVRPVVTCADCKYNTREVNDLFGNKAIQCITGLTHRHDWFCADGVKKEES